MHFGRLTNSQGFGRAQEANAARYLCSQGLRLICRNYHSRYGEIDLIMADSGILVFIEVRYRHSRRFGSAIATVTPAKQRKIRLTAAHYLQSHPQLQHSCCRFDVIGLSHGSGSDSKEPSIDWIKNAFE
ncbi:MAG: YraN family protein [Pseudohongiellaceae bacterium]